MEYDLIRLFDHPVYLADHIAPAIVAFEVAGASGRAVRVEWRASAGAPPRTGELGLVWDVVAIRARHPLIDHQLRSLRERDDDQGRRTELAAIAVAVGVLEVVEPGTRVTGIARVGTRHDFYLNDTRDEMVEVAGLWEGGLDGLFEQKRAQSELNPDLRKRWVSVTIARQTPRNRTEGLHP